MTSSASLIILGAGGHASSVADAAQSAGFSITGFFSPDKTSTGVGGTTLSTLEPFDLGLTSFALGVGTNYSRESVFLSFSKENPDARVVSLVHSTAWVSPSASLGEGSVVLAHAFVGPHCKVGPGAIINTGASLDHDSTLGAFASLGPGARTGGNVKIGSRTMVGMQAAITHGVSVGSDTVIGANSLVNGDIESSLIAFGSPAKIIRARSRDEPYF
jgi:sugar O-acyltransferase (sialic acid O-acetyltransferase NeuD family)